MTTLHSGTVDFGLNYDKTKRMKNKMNVSKDGTKIVMHFNSFSLKLRS